MVWVLHTEFVTVCACYRSVWHLFFCQSWNASIGRATIGTTNFTSSTRPVAHTRGSKEGQRAWKRERKAWWVGACWGLTWTNSQISPKHVFGAAHMENNQSWTNQDQNVGGCSSLGCLPAMSGWQHTFYRRGVICSSKWSSTIVSLDGSWLTKRECRLISCSSLVSNAAKQEPKT